MELTLDQVEGLLELPAGERPRIYANLADGQITRVASLAMLDHISDITGAPETSIRQRATSYRLGTNTSIYDLVRRT